MQSNPIPTVGALILNENNEIFLMSSPMWNGRYIIPGGHIEVGEHLEQALRREVKEETNLDITDIRFLMLLECIHPPHFAEKKHFLFIDYVCRALTTNVMLNEEGTNYVWITPEKMNTLPVEDYTRKVIELYVQK